MTAQQAPTVELEGYLGKDRELRWTQPRSYTVQVPHPDYLPEDKLFLDEVRTTSPRAYLKLSLATHQGAKTTWHELVIWDVDRGAEALHPAFLARKGDRVRVTGHFCEYSFTDKATGRLVTRRHLVVHETRFVRRRRAPEIP